MTGQPKKKLKEVEELADNCFTVSLNACCVIPKHYMNRARQLDARDEIGRYYQGVYSWSMMLSLVSEKLENLLRKKNGLEPRRSRFDEAFERNQPAEPGELEQQMNREGKQLLDGDMSMLSDDGKRWP